jgi:hypothetical protein
MDLKALLLTQGVIVATCLSNFVASRQLAPEPSASSPSAPSSSSSLCPRALATTLWAAVFAFFSLMADEWPASKAVVSLRGDKTLRLRLAFFLLFGPLHPLIGIAMIFGHMFTTLRFRHILRSSTNPERGPDTMSMSNKLRSVIDNIRAILFGINQQPGFLKRTRIVANTYILLGVSDSAKISDAHINRHRNSIEDNMADVLILGHKMDENSCLMEQNDALTLGDKTKENSCLKELNRAGKLALLDSDILPDNTKLRFLDGRSGIATCIISVQAVGYVTSIVYRAIHHLPVSPIEAIGFVYSMLVIVHSVFFSVGVICQNSLVIYLNPAQEEQMLDKCQSNRWSNPAHVIYINAVIVNAAIMGTMVVGSVMVAFTILVEWRVLKISWLDAIGPILFLLSLITQLFLIIIIMKQLVHKTLKIPLLFGSVMISFGGIVVSIVATIKNWHSDKFDSPTPSMIHNLPFLG